jgi:hypothetical protein
MRPDCPKCSTANPKKSGHAVGRQRWKCKSCGYEFTRQERPGKSYALKLQAANLYQMGCSSNQVAMMLQVSPTSVLKWTRALTWPTGRVHHLKPRFRTPEPYRSLFQETQRLGTLVKEQAALAHLR